MLLINPPAYDTRLPWARWQQPLALLRLATYCSHAGADARLIDMLQPPAGKPLRRQRAAIVTLDGIPVNKWRYGIDRFALTEHLRHLDKSGWHPDAVYVECFTSSWWEGAHEVIRCVRQRFPQARILLLGAYAASEPEHAIATAEADAVLTGPCDELDDLPFDFALYDRPPSFTYLSFGNGRRSAEDLVAEVEYKHARWNTQHFAVADHEVVRRFPDQYASFLEMLASRSLHLNLFAAGNVAPGDLLSRPELAALLRSAGCGQIFFADDRAVPLDALDQLLDDYHHAASLCRLAGFTLRTDNLNGGVSLGRPGEDLAERARFATLVAHHVGSVIVWPYAPAPHECPGVPPDMRNGKLFPLRQQNGYTYRDYLDVLALATVLNSKYRTSTFDFLGDGLVARLFRDSMARRAWDPDPAVKGAIRLPLAVRE